METWKERFISPNRRYGIFPIVHGRIVPRDPNDTSFEKWIDKLDRRGFAGIVGNITYNEGFPDNADEWERTENGFRKVTDRGMKAWIYDENGYPSGTAGGAVLDRHPEYCAQGLYCYEYWRTLSSDRPWNYRADVPGDKLFCAMLLPLDGSEAIDVTDMQDENGTLRLKMPAGSYHLFTMSIRRLFDGTHAAESYSEPRNYISLSDRKATEEFISITHENYAKVIGDTFGDGTLAFFTDEPSLIAWQIRQGIYPVVPYHHTYPEAFEKRFGYPFSLAVVAVVTGRGPDKIKRRCDFWDFIADTVADNYFGTISEWCHSHGIKSSGHLLREENLQSHVYNYGSFFRCASKMDWPGIDQLSSEPQKLMSTKDLPIARFLASFSDISGENESFTEFSDHESCMNNVQIGMDFIRASVNYHFAMGINNLTSYYSFERFSDEEIRKLNLYTSRIGELIREGKRDSHVAVLYPEAAIWSAYTPSITEGAMDKDENTCRINDCFTKTSWELLHRQIDFDYIDERILNEAVIKDGKLCWRDRAYECVIFPEAQVLKDDSVAKIRTMLDSDIGAVFIGELPKYSRDTGAEFNEPFESYRHHQKLAVIQNRSGRSFPGKAHIPAIPRPVTVCPDNVSMVLTGAEGSGGWIDGEIISPDILTHTRITKDGTKIIFVTNMGGKTFAGKLCVSGGCSAKLADPKDGSVSPADLSADENGISVHIVLKPYEGKFYIINKAE